MDLFRVLFLVIGVFVLEKLDFAHSQNETYRQCQYIPHLYDTDHTAHLKGEECLQSQMADESRFALLDILNFIRSNTAKGEHPESDHPKHHAHTNVYKLKYHWICEYFAMRLVDTLRGDGLAMSSLAHDFVVGFVKEIGETILKDKGNVGSFGETSTIDRFDYSYARFQVPEPVSNQSVLIENFGKKLVSTYDYSSHTTVLHPGASYCGCSVRVNVAAASKRKRQSSTSNVIVCVFSARPDSDKSFKDGDMTEDSCKAAKPDGFFDKELNLCIDKLGTTHEFRHLDMPCQFYYTNVSGGIPPKWMKKTCEGADFITDTQFRGIKNDTQVIYGDDKIMVPAYDKNGVEFGPPETDSGNQITTAKVAALELHSIPISLIIFIASISAIFSLP